MLSYLHRSNLVLLSSLILLTSCNQTVPTTGSNPDSSSVTQSSDIRPSTKGQRLELASLEGEMLIPAGTSSFVIQSTYTVAQGPLLEWFMPSAQAEDTIESGDEPIDLESLNQLQATVDGEDVELEILKTEKDLNQDTIVYYRLKKVPVTEDNAIIEFYSPSGGFKMKAIIPKIAENMRRLDQRLTPESTALVAYLKTLGKIDKPKGFTTEEIESLQKTDLVQNIRNQIYDIYIRPSKERKPPHFDEELKRRVEQLPVSPEQRTYIDRARVCFQNPEKCGSHPTLPPRAEQPIPTALRTEVERRLEVRRRFFESNAPLPVSRMGSVPRPLTAEEIQNLQNMGPAQRRLICVQKLIQPCPGN